VGEKPQRKPAKHGGRRKPRARGPHRWKPRHIHAARLRAAGTTWAAVAKELGVAPRTVERYASLPGWDDLVTRELGDVGRQRIRDLLLPTIQRLTDIVTGKEGDARDAVAASKLLVQLIEKHGPLRDAGRGENEAVDTGGTSLLGSIGCDGPEA
jgi:hypothetical protein